MRDLDPFLGAPIVDVLARIESAARHAAGAPLTVRVGDVDTLGLRNVAVDLPRGRRTRQASRVLRIRLRDALGAIGVVLAPHALGPRVEGDIRGSVRVREAPPRSATGDAASLCQHSE